MTNLSLIAPPAEPAVSLTEAKAYLRIGHDGEDSLIADLVAASIARVEQTARLALVTRLVQVAWSCWPAGLTQGGARFPVVPVSRFRKATRVSPDGRNVDYSDRFIVAHDRLSLKGGYSLPSLQTGDQFTVEAMIGFGAAADVPDDLKEAVLRLTSAMYSARPMGSSNGDRGIGMPADVRAILDARQEVRL
ncbi:MAG: hypothetical protein AAGL90_09535 [Pseudomonadota bacterium]